VLPKNSFQRIPKEKKMINLRVLGWKIFLAIIVLLIGISPLNAQEKIGEIGISNDWIGEKARLILKIDNSKVLKGKIVNVEKNGVTFDPKREGIFYDPPSKFYPFNNVETLIDNSGKVIFSNANPHRKILGTAKSAQNPSNEDDNNNKYVFPYRIRLNADYGYSSRRVSISDKVSSEYKDYLNDLKSGTNFNTDISFFISDHYGIGFKYSRFSASTLANEMPIYDYATSEILGYGILEDNISISFVGIAVIERKAIIPDKLFIGSSLAIGQISYYDDAGINTYPVKIDGKSIGFCGSIGLDSSRIQSGRFGLHPAHNGGCQ
jgi:hypothetical protein